MTAFSHLDHVGVRVHVDNLAGTVTLVVGAGATAAEFCRAVAMYVPESHRLESATTPEAGGRSTFVWVP